MRRLATILLPLHAAATEGDFRPEHSGWNGLSELADLARGMGMAVEVRQALDLDATAARTTSLLLFSPAAAPDPAPLLRFLRRGGRALLADDHAQAGPLFEALHIERAPMPAAAAADRYRENPHLPVARPAAPGPLVDGVEHVVTNHPAYLRSRLPAVLQISSPLFAVAVAGEIAAESEAGRFVALSDPSVLINNMLAFEGNLAFARNLLAWLGRPGARLVFLCGDFALLSRADAGRRRPGLGELRRQFNAFVAGLSPVPPRGLLRGLAILLSLGLGAALLVALRLPKRPPRGPFAVSR
jgi:hypothetical protein